AMALVMQTLPLERRTFGLGAMAAAAEAGGLVGPIWGGGIAQVLGWRGVFWINIPLCLPIAFMMLRQSRLIDRPQSRRVDFAGAALLGVALVFLTVALTDDPVARRPDGLTAALYAGAAIAFAAFLLRQFRAHHPLVDLSIFRKLPISAGIFTNGLVGGALIVAMVTLPLFTNVVLLGSAIEGGLNLMRLTVALPIGALLGGYTGPRLGLSRVGALAMLLAGGGFLLMSRWDASPAFLTFSVPLFIAGLGLGLIIAPVNSSVLEHVAETERATVSSLLTVMRLIGALVGVGLLTTRGLGGFYAQAGLIPLDDPSYVDHVKTLEIGAFHDTFLAAAIVCFATIIPALLLRPPATTSNTGGPDRNGLLL
ncbi:MAG TPA: MFS transporter, partial [Dehalococcoidia bacterium]